MKIIFRDWNSGHFLHSEEGDPSKFWPAKSWRYGPNRDKYFVREVNVDEGKGEAVIYVEEKGWDE